MSGQQTGGAGSQAGGASTDDNNQKSSVSYETYSRTVDEVKNLKAKVKEFEDQQNSAKEANLKAQNDWKALAEAKENQLKELQSKFDGLNNSLTDSIKLSAFQKNLGGKLRSEEYFDFVDTDKIVYNPETKKVDEASVKAVVAEFVKKHSSLVEFGTKGKLPNEAARGTDGRFAAKKSIEEMTAPELEQHILEQHEAGLLKEE